MDISIAAGAAGYICSAVWASPSCLAVTVTIANAGKALQGARIYTYFAQQICSDLVQTLVADLSSGTGWQGGGVKGLAPPQHLLFLAENSNTTQATDITATVDITIVQPKELGHIGAAHQSNGDFLPRVNCLRSLPVGLLGQTSKRRAAQVRG